MLPLRGWTTFRITNLAAANPHSILIRKPASRDLHPGPAPPSTRAAASLDWSLIDPTIFGTLFEPFLDPDKRAQTGAYYTDPAKIMMIVEPVERASSARVAVRSKGQIFSFVQNCLT